MKAEVLDGYGQPADLQRYPCTPQYQAWNNFAGSRQSGVVQGFVLQTSEQMGPFQINAHCKENPKVRSSADQLTVSTSKLSPRYGAGPDGAEPGVNTGLAVLGITAAVGGAVALGLAVSNLSTDTGGGGTCYLRTCIDGAFSCPCQEFNESALCSLPTTGVGGVCIDGGGNTIALCPDGYSCINSTCRNDC